MLTNIWERVSEISRSSWMYHTHKWQYMSNDTVQDVDENIQGIEGLLYPFIPLVEEQRKMLLNANISLNINVWKTAEKGYTVLSQSNDIYMQDIHKFKVPIIKVIVPKETLKKYMVQTYYNMSFDGHHRWDYQYHEYHAIEDTGLKTSDWNQALNSPLPFNYRMLNIKFNIKSVDNDSHATVGFIHVLSDAIVLPEGEVLYKDVKLHPGGCWYEGAPKLTNQSVYNLKFAAEVFTISQRHGNAVFHVMIEDVPRLVPYLPFLKQHKQIKIHVKKKESVTRQMLALLGIEEERLIDGYVRARIMYMPMGSRCGVANMFNIHLLSMYCRRTISQPKKDVHGDLILIKRSAKRFFTHHDHILEQLQLMGMRYNTTIKIFADKPVPPFKTIMRMFNTASMIVGPHGAGFSNVIFAKPGTVIIEAICTKRKLGYVNHSFAILSFILGHVYYGIIPNIDCTTVTETHLVPPVLHYLTWLQSNKRAT